jgi:hypothetical protein
MEKSAHKKAYARPGLTVHGTVADLTQIILVAGVSDGAVAGATLTKTTLI